MANDGDFTAIDASLHELIREYARFDLAEDIKKTVIGDWVEETVQISLKTVYNNLDPQIMNFVDARVDYDADAQRIAWKRIATARYRTAEDFKTAMCNPRQYTCLGLARWTDAGIIRSHRRYRATSFHRPRH